MLVVLVFAPLIATVVGGSISSRSVTDTAALSNSHSDGAGAPGRDIVTWNQNQNGKYNLQVSLKDVKIIAVVNSDYYDDSDDLEYDYGDVVYSTGSTGTDDGSLSSSGSGTSDNSTSSNTTTTNETLDELDEEDLALVLSHLIPKNTTKHPHHREDKEPVHVPFGANGKPENITQLPSEPGKRATIPRREIYRRKAPTTTHKPIVECELGYVRDRLGRCRKIRRRRPSFFPFKLGFRGFRLFGFAEPQRHHEDSPGHGY